MIDQEKIIDKVKPNQLNELSQSSSTVNTNEKLLLILNKETGLAPYSHEFVEGYQDPQILSGFISAISNFMEEVTGNHSSQWKTVFGSDSLMLVEAGEWSICVLVAGRETTEIRSRLRRIIREFEDCFEYLRDVEGIQNIFHDFDDYVRRMFVDERISDRTLVTKNPRWRSSLSYIDLPSTTYEVTKVLIGFEESASINEIVELQNIERTRVIDIVSKAYWHGVLSLTYIPSDDDILALSEKASRIIFAKTNPLKLSRWCLRVLALLDGRIPLSNLINNMLLYNKDSLLVTLGSLINGGFVQRISIEKYLVLLNECILSNLVLKGASLVGSCLMKQYFDTVSIGGISIHPRISRITLLDNMHVSSILEDNMTPSDLDDMIDALDYFIEEITWHLSNSCGVSVAKRLLEKVRETCGHNWAPYFSDVVL